MTTPAPPLFVSVPSASVAGGKVDLVFDGSQGHEHVVGGAPGDLHPTEDIG